MQYISVRGAREHNLRNLDIDLPRNKLVVITGVSGSGKSSLAFDTIYAEGQRRYVESLSAYARQFLELMQKPDVDAIEGLSPAISIEQKTTSKNPRSTVGTVTEIYDYLRLLYARVGIPYSPVTGLPIESQTVSEMVDRIMALPAGKRLLVLAPIVRGRKGEYRKELLDLQKRGFQRVLVDGTIYQLGEVPPLSKNHKHTIEVVVDRLVVNPGIENRLADTLETALKLGEDIVYVQDADTQERLTFSAQFACPQSGFTIDKIEPRLFSFNNPFGACPKCDGLGVRIVFDPDLVIPNKAKSLRDGAIVPWSGSFAFYYLQALDALARHFKFSTTTPFSDLDSEIQHTILYGSGSVTIPMIIQDQSHTYTSQKAFEGVIPALERRYKETDNERRRTELQKYQREMPCDDCHGHRLNAKALAIKINDLTISEVTKLSVAQAQAWFHKLPDVLKPKHRDIAQRILKEINERLSFLVNVGLGYLTLSRNSGTLSGGESQRIRLASQIGAGLTGVLYVLDEPSIGLHQRDNDKLLATLKRLRDLDNTVIVVEHDEDAIRTADYVVDMGPGAGALGGQVVAQGTPEEIIANPESMTGAYLSQRKQIPVPTQRRQKEAERVLTVVGAQANNLKDVTAEFPLGLFTCVTGVSGGGKSSLVIETFYKNLYNRLNSANDPAGPCEAIIGCELVDKIIDIDQSPIGRTPRSNPATYTGAFDPIRDWFAALPESKARGYGPGRFSFNVKGGRCEACQGDGVLKIEMHFLPDVYVPCDQCKGQRYNRETLEIKYKDKSIADVLMMTVEEALGFFGHVNVIRDKLQTLVKVGLGYIQVGQRATTLSGGEAQRVKLAKELSRRSTGRTVYILDEPTTGLHFADIQKLLEVLHALVDQGNTVVVIEHNLEVIKTADWILDMGPEGGDGGGQLLFAGTPEALVSANIGFTGPYLKPYLAPLVKSRARALVCPSLL
jgi:excinuclease ABC subunit A